MRIVRILMAGSLPAMLSDLGTAPANPTPVAGD